MDKLFGGKFVSAIVLFCYFFLNSFYNYTVTGSGLETDPYEIHERLILIVNETTSMNPLGIFKEEIDPMCENLDLSSLDDMFDNMKVINCDDDTISIKSGFHSLGTIYSNIFSHHGVGGIKKKDSIKPASKKSGNKNSPKKKNQKSKGKKKKTPNTNNGRVTRSGLKK